MVIVCDDQSIIGGIEIEGNSVMVIGVMKKEERYIDKIKRNLACHSLKDIERQKG